MDRSARALGAGIERLLCAIGGSSGAADAVDGMLERLIDAGPDPEQLCAYLARNPADLWSVLGGNHRITFQRRTAARGHREQGQIELLRYLCGEQDEGADLADLWADDAPESDSTQFVRCTFFRFLPAALVPVRNRALVEPLRTLHQILSDGIRRANPMMVAYRAIVITGRRSGRSKTAATLLSRRNRPNSPVHIRSNDWLLELYERP